MAEGIQQAKDDIAFIKGFLGGNGRAPVAVGHFYFLVGVVFSLHALRQFCLDMGWELPSLLTAYEPWDTLGLFLIGCGISSTLMWRQGQALPDDPQDLNPAARAALSAWGAVSFAVLAGGFSLWLSSSAVEELLVAGMILFAVSYSVGWSVTHTVHRVGWHKLVAWGFTVWAVAIGTVAGSPWLTLVIALGLLALFAVPGYRIIREADASRQAGARDQPVVAFDINRIDDVIHGRLRLGIMAHLVNAGVADFNELKTLLRATQGNLSVHLRKLEEAGYITIEKGFLGRKPNTKARLTKEGRKAFAAYLDGLSRLIEVAR